LNKRGDFEDNVVESSTSKAVIEDPTGGSDFDDDKF
jgi:hypothetical protein